MKSENERNKVCEQYETYFYKKINNNDNNFLA